jgi:hypothetical protein
MVLDINEEIPLDVLVYSKEELKMVKEYGNTFVIDVEKTGKVIYEKVHSETQAQEFVEYAKEVKSIILKEIK